MKRLVYSPSMKVWVKSDSGVIDLSPYVTRCNIERKINDLSTAQVEFRNPKVMQNGKSRFLFTQHVKPDGTTGPLFHPMDPITIVFERIAGKPIQVFTGYCDAVPYVQLFPGTTRLTASCTLKRLNYTYFDAGLTFVTDFMANYGWALDANGKVSKGTGEATSAELEAQQTATAGGTAATSKVIKQTNLNDSSIANLLYATLNEIGGWDPGNIFIQPLPKNISKIVGNLFDEITKDNKKVNEEIANLLKEIVGSGSYGSGVTGSTDTTTTESSGGSESNDASHTEIFETVRMASWIVPILKYARGKGWTGSISSGWRSYAKQKELYDNRASNPNPVAAPGTSNHEGSKFPKGAVDVDDNSASQLSQILLNSEYASKLVWAGDADPVHFSHPHNGSF